MAQPGNNGGGNNPMLPFGYDPNYLQTRQSSSSEPPRQQHLQQTFNQSHQAVLDPSDSDLMHSFFQNPDAASSSEDVHSVSAWPMDHKPSDNQHFGPWYFTTPHHLPDQPQSALVDRPQGSFQPPTQQNVQHTQHMDEFYQQHATGAGSDADMLSGASSLFNLSNQQQQQQSQQQQQQQDPSSSTGFGGASWGHFGAGVGHGLAAPDSLQSPLTSSGRQSSGGSLYTPTSGSLSHQQLGSQFQFQQMMRDHQQQQGQAHHTSQSQAIQQQQQISHSGQHTRHPSLQLDTGHSNLFQMLHQGQNGAPWLAQQALQYGQQNHQTQRPAMLRFGTDSMVQGPHSYRSDMSNLPEQNKASNLMGVPLADQIAAGGPSSSIPQQHQMHMQDLRAAYEYTMRQPGGMGGEGPTRPSSAGAGPPMTAFGNMSVTSPMSAITARPGTSWESYGDDTYQQGPTRKRRKSQTEREESGVGAWSPPSTSAATRGNIPKRGPKVPKAEDAVEEDEDPSSLDAMNFSQNQLHTPKRRKSTMAHATRPSFSQISVSSVSPTGSTVTGTGESSSQAVVAEGASLGSASRKGKARESKSISSRQNLTEDQKRANHIQSEQKRRNIIKQGYDDLNILVPSLQNGKSGFSKSEILKEVVAYLESQISGNAAVKELFRDQAVAEPGATTSAAGTSAEDREAEG